MKCVECNSRLEEEKKDYIKIDNIYYYFCNECYIEYMDESQD